MVHSWRGGRPCVSLLGTLKGLQSKICLGAQACRSRSQGDHADKRNAMILVSSASPRHHL